VRGVREENKVRGGDICQGIYRGSEATRRQVEEEEAKRSENRSLSRPETPKAREGRSGESHGGCRREGEKVN